MITIADDAEYELDEVWDGEKWIVTKRRIVKKSSPAKDVQKSSMNLITVF